MGRESWCRDEDIVNSGWQIQGEIAGRVGRRYFVVSYYDILLYIVKAG
jgi:hypothetical protein